MVQANSVKPKIIIISGPTAIGKSAAALDVAKTFGGEIISADSMQIYKQLNIGTGKLKKEEMSGIEHYLINIRDPDEGYSVSEFSADAKSSVIDIAKKGKLPIIVGGTGLYINSLINGFSFSGTPKSEGIRAEFEDIAIKEGILSLYERLRIVDIESAKKISINDKKRIIRALEIFYLSGKPKSEAADTLSACEFDYLFFVIDDERERIYEHINLRVDKMFADGLVDEVKGLIKYRNCQSMQAIGYKEIVGFLENKNTFAETIDAVKQNSRRYAKRQLTYLRWLKAEKTWCNVNEFKNRYEIISKFTSSVSNKSLLK